MTNTPAIATTIEEVLEHLENIIHTSVSREDRIGFFAALYHKVTLKVKEDIDSDLFEDGSRLAYLDVLFANRYLHAAYEWQRDPDSPLVSKSWKKAFQNLSSPRKLVLQHLLLGMNAHINLDLGIAVVEAVNNGSTIDDLRKDYNSINNILAGLTYGVINNLRMISPFLSIIGLKGSNSNSMLIQFSLSTARDGAWLFATDLIQKQPHEAEVFIAERDNSIEGLGQMLVTNKGFLRVGIFITYLFEWKKASRITTLLHTHKKLSMNELK